MLMALAALVLIPIILLWMRDNPADIGLGAYGSMGNAVSLGRHSPAGWSTGSIRARCLLQLTLFVARRYLFYRMFPRLGGLFVSAILYGLDWSASGPPTTTLLAHAYGQERLGRLVGSVFVFHQLGGALAAFAGGWARMQFGNYEYAFLAGGFMGLVAAAMALMIGSMKAQAPAVPMATKLAAA
jgi:sugar phosphate permease